jgi:hypothetical protein
MLAPACLSKIHGRKGQEMALGFAHSVKRVTIEGISFGGAEEWTTGFYVGLEGGDASNPTQTFADAIRDAWLTFFTSGNSYISNYWNTTRVKVSQISAAGVTLPDNTIYSAYATLPSGGKAGGSFPPQIAMVATLMTPRTTGIGSKGRMYLPGIWETVQVNGGINSTATTNIANGLKTFLNAVNTAAPASEKVILATHGHKSDGSGKANVIVNKIRVGSIYDTQRRRRNQLVENYLQVTL